MGHGEEFIPIQIMFATDKFHVGARHPPSFGISNILQVPCPHPSVAFFFQNGIIQATRRTTSSTHKEMEFFVAFNIFHRIAEA
ncbi:hypothetical protein NIES37_20780 [Tolypothrix tenuis PCC 7101]|uniref:Uncharacterized protein n=1 Tax=Tolypothrix tenuis PCC 7101 TaxID=231146 RepID=A0A1Z4MXG6_9CYAN|nr:hypothetical protein NIES37_20780 [Tolypothrix tenuis PCC 7101]BAZ77951.1 hypothetical protein NIES50_65840 [Aulosira laxa NIES-50]